MNLTHTCLECLYKQIHNFLHTSADSHTFQTRTRDEILHHTKDLLHSLEQSLHNTTLTPPKAAIAIYKNLSKALQNQDPYKHIKQQSIESAATILATLKDHKAYAETLSDCIKVAVLGNVIDYGSQSSFSFESSFDFGGLEFARFDIEAFEMRLCNAKNLLYIADNAGENLFDIVLLQFLKNHYPNLHITYLVRGAPIINDVTLADLANPLCAEIYHLCDVKSSHMESPGFIYDDAPKEIKDSFDSADVIVAKGMGNYECLESIHKENLFLLFKVKCSVVAAHSGFELGKMVFLQNKGEAYA